MIYMTKGTYTAKVIESALAETKSGSEQVVLRFENSDGEVAVAYLSLSDRAFLYSAKKLAAVGFDVAKQKVSSLNGDESPILGNEAEIVVEEEEYDGKIRTKVSWINPVGGGGGSAIQRLPPDKAKALDEKVRRLVATITGGTGASSAKPAPAPKRKREPGDDDDEPAPWEA